MASFTRRTSPALDWTERASAVRGEPVESFAAPVSGTDFFKANLEEADVTDAFGHFAYFCRADVSNATFDGASLFHASVTDAVCLRTSFIRADLQGADLGKAMPTEASLQEARLWRANLEGASMNSQLRLAGATGIEHTRVASLRFEGERVEGKPSGNSSSG